MCHQIETSTPSSAISWRPCLTEQNLRLHGAVHIQTSNDIKQQCKTVAASICDDSDDEGADDIQNIDRQRAASLQALEVYGGCFVSGFLAMQEPLPWLSTPTLTSGSDSSTTSTGSPRPDSATLSREDILDLSEGQKSKWRSVKKMCKLTRKSKA